MQWMNGCNAMLKWGKSRKSRKSTKVAHGPHTEIWKINESCTRSSSYIKEKLKFALLLGVEGGGGKTAL